ncbi:MAG: 3-isopropylmalate dehydratase small subunit [Armatimonadota bacterium]|nr:3-isopropylmalate dehydratase small subunit [Armatimonadota bacterium]MDW8156435.1 3-isopropylmalate dehydratase small subunit [Armatimonadota bacterium]
MPIRGRAHKVGDHIDTDLIIAGRYLVTTDPAKLGEHLFEDLDPGLRQRIRPGDIVVAGENFGQGSSREHAPLALVGAGVSAVVAASYARIFYRNAFNNGLLLLECPEASQAVQNGDELEVDPETGQIRNLTRGEAYQAKPIPPFMQELTRAGGIIPYVRRKLGLEAS